MAHYVQDSLSPEVVNKFMPLALELLSNFRAQNNLSEDQAAGLQMFATGVVLHLLGVSIESNDTISDALEPLLLGWSAMANQARAGGTA